MTQKDIAVVLGIPYVRFNAIINGRCDCGVGQGEQMMKRFGGHLEDWCLESGRKRRKALYCSYMKRINSVV